VVDSQEQKSDPVIVEVPVAIIKRDLTIDGSEQFRQLADPTLFIPGAGLYLKSSASASSAEVNISDPAFADVTTQTGFILPYDVKDLESAYDGSKLIFSMRAPELANTENQPTWNIWQYDVANQSLSRIISSDIVAEAGHDTGPVYLADGRILFSSTRQRANQARLLDEGKPQYSGLEEGLETAASVLHVMDSNGENIQQISFNQSHDLDPIISPQGKVVFSRWDQHAGDKGVHLYQMNVDGSELEILYGRHSHIDAQGDAADIHFTQSRITPDGQILAALSSFDAKRIGTNYVVIDADNFIDIDTPIAQSADTGPGQLSALFTSIDIESDVSLGGYVGSLYPLADGSQRQLFTWSQCRLIEPLPEDASELTEQKVVPCENAQNASMLMDELGYTAAPPLYGLWMFDPFQQTQLPLSLPTEDQAYVEVVALENRAFPSNPESTVDLNNATLIDEQLGLLHIRSVYDFDGTDSSQQGIDNIANPSVVATDQRPYRFIRITKSVSIPDRDTLRIDGDAFGRSRQQLMREILGYAPIQPDGSVQVAIPANVPFTISLLDVQGRRVSQRHENWLQLVPGEKKTCYGCHRAESQKPHGRIDAQAPSINLGAATTGVAFPGTNPVLFADLGETMAQVVTRINGLSRLTPDILFEDIWTDPAQQTPAQAIQLSYQALQTRLPITQACAQNWNTLCRSVINFPQHIAPLFTLPRQQFDAAGEVVSEHTCTSCHSPNDASGMLQVPAAQLDLSVTASTDNADLLTSYRELLFNDNEQVIVDGALLDRLIPVLDNQGNPVFEVDEDGELIFDAQGNPIPVLRNVAVRSAVSVNGARASERFFAPFNNGSHQGWMSDSELRLMTEWLDIGAQNYNNPFDVPVN